MRKTLDPPNENVNKYCLSSLESKLTISHNLDLRFKDLDFLSQQDIVFHILNSFTLTSRLSEVFCIDEISFN